jgi:uncharacterized GH25 family protein
MLKPLGLALALTLDLSVASAHEFWVAPLDYQVQEGDQVQIDLRVGQMLEGRSYPYLSHKFNRYQLSDRRGVHDLLGNEGNLPSVSYEASVPGLHVIAYEALPEFLVYDNFQAFDDYVREEGHAGLVDRHRERDLPEAGFTEAYVRNAKALIQVGPATEDDLDRELGLPFEFITLKNPYNTDDTLPVKLLWHGSEVYDAQVAVFNSNSKGKISRVTYRTDKSGIVQIRLAGGGTFLLSAVQLEESDPDSGHVWESTWASLTFALPEASSR